MKTSSTILCSGRCIASMFVGLGSECNKARRRFLYPSFYFSLSRPSNDDNRMATALQFGFEVAGQNDCDEAQRGRQVLPPPLVTSPSLRNLSLSLLTVLAQRRRHGLPFAGAVASLLCPCCPFSVFISDVFLKEK
ncbi:hypothetical protein PIB30_020638 [Stylosanthes scabra]|uniref:Uncharacterized protein n=1 Tax=Stylosanthes scabra TaxID=79078 RepID=A0ABU6TAB1_9FABA|nr:hypothetical protein [Stylosanthes scabra]